MSRLRILILSPSVPFPADNGGKLRAAAVALALAARHDVAFGCFTDETEGGAGTVEVADRFRDLKVVPRQARRRGWMPRLSPSPSDVHDLHSDEMAAWVKATVARFSPDVLLAGDPALTPYLAPYAGRVRVLDYVCVATLAFERMAAGAPRAQRAVWGLRRLKFAAFLGRIARVYDLGIVNSEEDRAALVATSPDWARVEVLPNGLDLGAYPLGLATPDPATLVFHGALSYAPNLQAVRLLVDEILPRVRAEVPGVRLLVTGRIPTDGTAPQGSGVVYTGYVPDIRTVVAGAWASPTPLKSGAGGARFKVLEALALGTPLISTAMGAEGLAVTDGVDILMAEEPAAFAAQTVRMLRSPELRQRLAEGGRRLVEQRYNWARLGERLAARLEDLVARRATARATSAVAPVGQ